jgi:Immunity protein family (Imm11)
MKVYLLRADSDHYESVSMASGDLYEFARRFNGKPMKKLGKDARIKKDPRRVPKGDSPSLIPGVPIFSQRAVEALRDLLEANGELFPTKINSENYFIFNVTHVADVLDEPNSELSRFKDGRVFYIDCYSFVAKELKGLSVFKIPQMVVGDVYVTDAFVERADSAGLKGFWFLPVWSSDEIIEPLDLATFCRMVET